MENKYNRRSFLKRAASLGAIIATSQLPIRAEDDPSVFSKRGFHERLALHYGTVNIGLEKPFSILHISDTHLTAVYPHENEKKQSLHKTRIASFGGRQEEALRDSLEWAKQHVDYVVHTGDLLDLQSEANFDLVKKYFGNGICGCVGNHEFNPDLWLSEPKEEPTEQFKDFTRKKLQEVFPFNMEFHSEVINGVNFVTLDDVYSYVTEKQVKLFKNEVQKGLPIVLCLHVPFHTENIWRATMSFWREADSRFRTVTPAPSGDYKKQMEDDVTRDFIAYLKTEPLLKAILAGHLHLNIQDQFSPTATEFVVGGNFLFQGEEILFF